MTKPREKVLAALNEIGQAGLTKTEIRRLVSGGHLSRDRLDSLLAQLVDSGEITAGRDRRTPRTPLFFRIA